MKYFFTILITVVFAGITYGQDTIQVNHPNILYGIVEDGDTLLYAQINEVYILPMPKFNNKRDLRRYRKLIRNVKKVYPYSQMAKEKYNEVEAHMATLESEKEQKEYMKQVEKEIKEEFEGELKKLTISQGRILIKLIDREIGETSYVVLKEFRGAFTAVFWQTIARLFGNNLKDEFDAAGEDRLINEIILLIENGQL